LLGLPTLDTAIIAHLSRDGIRDRRNSHSLAKRGRMGYILFGDEFFMAFIHELYENQVVTNVRKK